MNWLIDRQADEIASLKKVIEGWRKIHQEDMENNRQICKTLDAVRLDSAAIHEQADRQAEQIAALSAERDRLKAKREIWEERNVSLEGKCAALAAERDRTDKAYQTLKNQVFDQQTTNEILTAENKRQSEEIRLLRRALGNYNPYHNLLMPEEALWGEEGCI